MLRRLRLVAAALLLCAAGPALAAASVPAPANAQSEIATRKAQVAALKDQRDLEKRLATLEGKTVAEDRSRDNLTKTITILGFIITFIAVVAGIASYYVGAARAVTEARGEVDKIRKEFTDFRESEQIKIKELDDKIRHITELASDVERQSNESAAKAEEQLAQMRQMVEEAAPHLEKIRQDAAKGADIVEQLGKAAARGKTAVPTEDQLRTLNAVTSESADRPESEWSIDQFKTAIGKAMYVDKNWTEAERLANAMERFHRANKNARLYALNRRGDAARELGRYADAATAYESAIAITTKTPPKRHQDHYIWAAHHLALCMNNLGQNAEAEAMLNELLPLCEKVDGPEASKTLTTRHVLARAILDQGRAPEAEAMLRALLPIREKVAGPEVSGTLITRHELARAVLDQSRAAEAEAMLHGLVQLRERIDGPEASETLLTSNVLARAILDQGRTADAEAMLCDLLPLFEKVVGPGKSGTLVTRYLWADALVQLGDGPAAEAALAPIPDPVTNSGWMLRHEAQLAFVRGRVADAFKDRVAADAQLTRADQIYASIYPPEHVERVRLATYRANRVADSGQDA